MKKNLLLPLLMTLCSGLAAQVNFTDSNLPILVINTMGQEIPDDPKITAQMGIIHKGPGQRNYLTDPFNEYNGKIGIEIRGSSSQSFPKKGYGLETWDAEGEDLDVSLLGMPKESDWVLHGPYSDKSLIRNALTYILAGRMMEYAPRVKMVELVINGEYMGVYLFTEKIKRDANRVNINKLDPDENQGDDLTGGYILKLDKTTGDNPMFPLYFSSQYRAETPNFQEIKFLYEVPDPEDITQQQRDYVQESVDRFENALHGEDYLDPETGYKNHIDVQTFIDFLLVNEVSKNVDGYRLSTFFYKDKDSKNPRWKMGPVWDFNLGFGNANYCDGGLTTGWAYDFNEVCPDDYWVIPFWWKKMLTDPVFRWELGLRWQELRSGVLSDNQTTQVIDSLSSLLGESQYRNFQRWNVLSEWVWPNNFIGHNYPAEIDYLRNWALERLAWMDQAIEDLTPAVDPTSGKPLVWQLSPNPAQSFVNIVVNEPGSIPLTMELFDALGRRVKTFDWPGQELSMRLETGDLSKGWWVVALKGQDGRISSRPLVVMP